METQNREDNYFKAKKRVAGIKKFYTSLLFYVIFICFLGGMNYYLNEWEHPWFLWAAFGWGIGLVFQALGTFKNNIMFGRDWEDRKMKKFMDEEARHRDQTRF